MDLIRAHHTGTAMACHHSLTVPEESSAYFGVNRMGGNHVGHDILTELLQLFI